MDTDYDVVVIGSGVAGALCAWRLSGTKDSSVLLLEAGDNPLDDPARDSFVDAYRLSTSKNAPSPYAWMKSTAFAPSSDGTGDPIAMNRY